jgi:hypothetical protein
MLIWNCPKSWISGERSVNQPTMHWDKDQIQLADPDHTLHGGPDQDFQVQAVQAC